MHTSQSCGTSLNVWDCSITCHPTQVSAHCLNPSQKQGRSQKFVLAGGGYKSFCGWIKLLNSRSDVILPHKKFTWADFGGYKYRYPPPSLRPWPEGWYSVNLGGRLHIEMRVTACRHHPSINGAQRRVTCWSWQMHYRWAVVKHFRMNVSSSIANVCNFSLTTKEEMQKDWCLNALSM